MWSVRSEAEIETKRHPAERRWHRRSRSARGRVAVLFGTMLSRKANLSARQRPRRLSLLALCAALLLLNLASGDAASQNPRSDQSKKAATGQSNLAQHQQAQVIPLSTFQSEQAALLEELRAIKAQTEAQRQQAQAEHETYSSPSVRVQIGLLAIGVLYTIFACLQWSAIKEQANIANRAIEQTFRPRIKLRAFEGQVRLVGDGTKSVNANDRRRISVQFELVNYGNAAVQILGNNCSIHLAESDDLPMRPPYLEEGGNRIAYSGFPAGMFFPVYINFDESIGPAAERALSDGRFHILGYINYRRANDAPDSMFYRTAFCRRWNPERRRFLPVQDTDYEYED
jgi:hypothetical protein